jgi:hypothetical protein
MAQLPPIPPKGTDAERAQAIARFLQQSQLPVIPDLAAGGNGLQSRIHGEHQILQFQVRPAE